MDNLQNNGEKLKKENEELINSTSSPKLVQPSIPLPIGIRCVVFSFLNAKKVIGVISALSKEIRNYILSNELLDQ